MLEILYYRKTIGLTLKSEFLVGNTGYVKQRFKR